MTHNPTWPLNEPIETDFDGVTITLLYRDDRGNYTGFSTDTNGVTTIGMWCSDGEPFQMDWPKLAPPRPARQYGYAQYCDDVLLQVELNATPPASISRSYITRFPIPRPGETLVVMPSREDVYDTLCDVVGSGNYGMIADAVMALLDGEA